MSPDLSRIRNFRILLVTTGIILMTVSVLTGTSTAMKSFMEGWKEGSSRPGVREADFRMEGVKLTSRPDSISSRTGGGKIILNKSFQTDAEVYDVKDQKLGWTKFYYVSSIVADGIIGILTILIFIKLYYFLKMSSVDDLLGRANIARVRRIGQYCILITVLLFVQSTLNYLVACYFFDHTKYLVVYDFDFNFVLFTVGVVTLAIIQIFKIAAGIKQEQDLTI